MPRHQNIDEHRQNPWYIVQLITRQRIKSEDKNPFIPIFISQKQLPYQEFGSLPSFQRTKHFQIARFNISSKSNCAMRIDLTYKNIHIEYQDVSKIMIIANFEQKDSPFSDLNQKCTYDQFLSRLPTQRETSGRIFFSE